MNRLIVGALAMALAVVIGAAGCGDSNNGTGQRHLQAQLQYDRPATHSIGGGQVVKTRAIDVVKAGLKAQAKLRAAKSPPFAKALAKHFRRMGAGAGPTDRLLSRARAAGKHPLDIAFEADVAAFVWDDSSGAWVDSIYLDPETGYFDALAPTDVPASVWVGTYDVELGDATIIAPMCYGFDCQFPPYEDDTYWDYDAYFWAPYDDIAISGGYTAFESDQSGYYQVDWAGGSAWFYLLPDNPAYGSYWLIWDDGFCTQGMQVYISFDASGVWFSVNGVDGPMTISGETEVGQEFYLSGTGRWTVVGEDGLNYEELVSVTYLGASPDTAELCPVDTLVLPPDPAPYSVGCVDCCPLGCEPNDYFGICVISGTLALDGTGLSCDLYDATVSLVICPVGCTEYLDGFCYDDFDPTLICY